MWLGAVYALTFVLFLLILLSLGFQPKFMTRITGFLLFISAVAGTLLYGYGYYALYANVPQAAVRTLFSVFCMFLGRNEISAISAVPLLKTPAMQVAVYAAHLLALYCTASAVVQTIGVRLIRTLRLFLIRRGDLHLIFSTGENALSFGKKLIACGKGTVVFADAKADSDAETQILRMGSLLFSGEAFRTPDQALLNRLGMRAGKRRMTLYCLSDDTAANLHYAQDMLAALSSAGISPDQTGLVALLQDEAMGETLQSSPEGERSRYGYGSVNAAEPGDLLARLMVKAFPPYAEMAFDGHGQASGDFRALIVGFGRKGQAVLRRLIMNGQFVGSRFHVSVAAHGIELQAGSFFSRYPALRDSETIDLIDADAHSTEFYRLLTETGPQLKYIALCTDSEKENGEIAQELAALFSRLRQPPLILQCSAKGIRRDEGPSGPAVFEELFTPDILCGDALDEKAKAINHQYRLSEGNSPEEDWKRCDYFSRLSSRASADFSDALLAAAGTSREQVLREGFSPDEATMERLGEMEHMRWCAFHAVMGYRPMPKEIWEERAAQYLAEKRKTGASSLPIGKDTADRLHACLVPYRELDELSARENAVTGGNKDYRQMDKDTVRAIPDLLYALQKEGKHP